MIMKDYLFSASAPSNPPFLPVGCCDCRRLRNDFSIPRAPENMSHKHIITIYFHIWTSFLVIPVQICDGLWHGQLQGKQLQKVTRLYFNHILNSVCLFQKEPCTVYSIIYIQGSRFALFLWFHKIKCYPITWSYNWLVKVKRFIKK